MGFGKFEKINLPNLTFIVCSDFNQWQESNGKMVKCTMNYNSTIVYQHKCYIYSRADTMNNLQKQYLYI